MKVFASRFAALFCCLMLLTSSSFAATYKSANGYSFTPPTGWQKLPNFGGSEILYRHSGGSNINVLSRALPTSNITVAQIRAASITQLRSSFKNYKLVAQGDTRLGGAPAGYLTSGYTMEGTGISMRVHQVFALRGSKLFVFTCTSSTAVYPRFSPIFQKTLRSVRWTR